MKLIGTMIGSDDPKKLGDFYDSIFGKAGWHEDEWYGYDIGGGSLMIGPHSEVHGQNNEPSRLMISFATDKVKAEFERIKGLGGGVVAKPYQPDPENSKDIWLATLSDPDGNYIQLSSLAMPKAPLAIQIGNPIIRKKLRTISPHDIKSEEVQNCIEKMRAVNLAMKGVGISANQVGYDLRISIIHIRSSKNRPGLKTGREVILINPELIHTPGKTEFMWEGCLSVAQAGLFCKVKRFKSVEVKYLDLSGSVVIEKLIGLEAHVAQHELDHLAGRVFLDQEFDPKTFMSSYEYRLMRKSQTDKKT